MGLSIFKNSHRNYPYIRNDIVMDTILEQQVWGKSGSKAAKKVIYKIKHLEKLWNRFDPGSLISKINQAAGLHPVRADRDTISIIKTVKIFSTQTDGTFDITVLPLLQLWQKAEKENKLPETEKLEKALSFVNSTAIIIDNNEIFLPLKGMAIDLGGIAKGYAVDIAREIYLNNGIKKAIINFGGNVMVIGTKPDGSKWKIGLQKPESIRGECFGFVEALNCSVVTSGNYERYYKIGEKYFSHIINPKTGISPSQEISSTTVISDSSIEADALATAAIVMGKEKARLFFREINDCQAIILDNNGKIEILGKTIVKFIRI